MKGILFKDWKIKAIAEDDREWQTRRLDGLKEINKEPDKWTWNQWQKSQAWCSRFDAFWFDDSKGRIDAPRIGVKPRYQVGEVVYIKEAFMIEQSEGFDEPTDRPFKNDYEWGLLIPHYKLTDPDPELYDDEDRQVKWCSPLFMPEWAARYFIKITDIRAERLQEITYGDCIKEGLDMSNVDYCPGWDVSKFKSLWNSINPKYPWESNPWVEVDSFKKAEIGVNAAKESMANV